MNVNVCPGCKRGAEHFIKKDEKIFHVVLHGTMVGSEEYIECVNSGEIETFLVKGEAGLSPNSELLSVLRKQEMWWWDLIDLAKEVLDEGWEKFLDENWSLENEQIEAKLLKFAEDKKIKVDKRDYPDIKMLNNEEIISG